MRTWFASWSLRRRLVVIILALAIPTVLAVAGVALGANVMILQDETQAAFLSQNQAFANALDSRLQSAATVARAFANSLSNQPDSPLSRVWQMANNTLSETGQIIRRVNVYAPLDGGRQVVVFNAPIPPVRVATVKQYVNEDFPADSWFTAVLQTGKPRWFGPELGFDRADGLRVISYAVPYRGVGGRWVGVVWVDIPVSALNRLMADAIDEEDPRSYSFLVTDANQVSGGFQLPVLPLEEQMTRLSDFMMEPRMVEMRAEASDNDGQFILGADPFDIQRESITLINLLPQSAWHLVTVLPASVIQNPFARSLAQIAVVTLAGMALLGWIVFQFTTHAIVTPLKRLATAAQEIGAGDLRYAIAYREQQDEVGWLANAMEEMKRNLEGSYDQLSNWSHTLERRVKQRTEELNVARQVAQVRAGELQAVYDASLSVVGDYQLSLMLDNLTQNILNLLKTRYCAVWLLTPDKKHLQLVASTNPNKSALNTLIQPQEGLVGTAFHAGELVLVEDYPNWSHRLVGFEDGTVEQAMAAPLQFFRKPIGAVLVGRLASDAPFSDPDQRLLTLFANLVSPVVRNAQLYIQREDAVREAERANSVKTRFLASVTHELRTPLNLIINNMDFMRIGMFGSVTEEQRSRLEQAVRSAEHLLSLINDLLDVSKIEAGEMDLVIQPADLYPVLEDAIDQTLMLMESKKSYILFERNIPDDLPMIPMDARRVRQILTNLLSNAVKFTPEGIIRLAVEVVPPAVSTNGTNGSAAHLLESGYVAFTVSDTGMGISAEEMDRLFLAFERAERAKHMGIEGTGLGLPISRFLARAHGGDLQVQSAVGAGSSFRFMLPMQPPRRERPAQTISAVIGVE